MKGLLYKDLTIMLSAYRSNIIFLLVLCLFISFSTNTSFTLCFAPFILVRFSLSCLALDESSHWDVYARTLPVKKSAVVGSKYLLTLITLGMGTAFCLVAAVLNDLLHGHFSAAAFVLNLTEISAICLSGVLCFAIAFPLSCKIGTAKANAMTMVILLILFALIILPQALLGPFDLSFLEAISDTQFMLFLVGVFAATLAGFFVSWRISTRIYTRKSY